VMTVYKELYPWKLLKEYTLNALITKENMWYGWFSHSTYAQTHHMQYTECLFTHKVQWQQA
jgi:hypothetical protein